MLYTRRYGGEGERPGMKAMTLNDIFEAILNISELQNLNCGRRVGRKERISAVFPLSIIRYLEQRSPSYLSWFLNDEKRGDPVRDYVGKCFDDDPPGFLREMTRKCETFLGVDRGVRISPDRLGDLLDNLGMHNPLFVRGSAGADNMATVAKASPSRVLAAVFLDASTGGLTKARYERILSCWHLMDREIIEASRTEPEKAILDGEILYADGHRNAAMHQFKKALKLLGKTAGTSERDPLENNEQANLKKRLLMKMGNMYLQGDGCDADKVQAALCFEECAALGCPEADYRLGVLQMQDGFLQNSRELFLHGAKGGDTSCLRMLGNAFYSGEALVGGKKCLSSAMGYFLSGAGREDTSSGDAYCQYMVGRILEDSQKTGTAVDALLIGREADPEYWFEAAANKGYRDSAAALNRRRWAAYGNMPRVKSLLGNIHYEYSPGQAISEIVDNSDVPGYGTQTDNARNLEKLPASAEQGDSSSRRKYCLLNAISGANHVFARTLPSEEYIIYVCTGEYEPGEDNGTKNNKQIQPLNSSILSSLTENKIELRNESVSGMLCHIVRQHIRQEKERNGNQENNVFLNGLWETFPEVLIMTLSDNEQINIRDGLQVLRMAFFLHNEMGALLKRTTDGTMDDITSRMFYLLSDRLRLYVLGRDSICAPLFDSTCGRLEGFYIPLFLCDRSKMASMSLLDQMPLFLPCLNHKGLRHGSKTDTRMDIAVFGDHPGIVQLCKDAIAVSQIDDIPFSLTVIGENADKLEKKFLAECPGITHPPQGVAVHRPAFLKISPESEEFQNLLFIRPKECGDPEQEKITAFIQSAAYLIVYADDPDRNLTLAMYLREWYIKTDPSFTRLPFIAMYCEKRDRAEQVRTLTAVGENAGFNWFNEYNIECFGTDDSIYSFAGLINSRLEHRALASHYSYYVNVETGASYHNSFVSDVDRFRAEHDYYVRSFNRDASMINALALPYRLFSAGIMFSDWHRYAAGISQQQLADEFEEWLKEGDDFQRKARLEVLAIQEHGRWNRAMLSRGWMGASAEQMQTYIQRGCSSHQLHIAKLHPFICSWERLGDTNPEATGMQKEYGFIMKQIRPGKEPSDIHEIDRENVRKTPILLREM